MWISVDGVNVWHWMLASSGGVVRGQKTVGFAIVWGGEKGL